LILVDDQGGSKGRKGTILELLNPLIAAGLPAVTARLDSADLAFLSKDGLDIGIELKRLDGGSTDLIQSLRSGRLSGHQLPKMLGPQGAYDYGFLIIEGMWQQDDDGQVVVYRGKKQGWIKAPGRMFASELEKRLLNLELKYERLTIKDCNSRRDTIRFISNCYRYWMDKSFASHTSHLQVHDAPTIQPVSEYRAFYMRLPNVGYALSLAVENHFKGGPRQAVCAGVAEWAEITTGEKKLGLKRATEIVAFCRGGI
jgi:ERCC4 domain